MISLAAGAHARVGGGGEPFPGERRDDESGDPEEFDTPPGLFTALFVAGDFLFCPCSPEQFEEGLLKMLDPEQRSLVGAAIRAGAQRVRVARERQRVRAP